VPRLDPRRRIVSALFGLLYRNRLLYWLASTIPFAGQWRVWQRLALAHLTGPDVLEAGCGPGKLLADLVAAGYACAAVDRSPQMLAAARAELRRRGFAAAATPILLASVQQLPFPDASFDDVVSTFPTDYIADPQALREIARVLRPGGRLIVVLGAELLPTTPLLWPSVGVQRLVYGRHSGVTCASGAATAMPCAQAGLTGRDVCVRGSFWLAHLVIAQRTG